MIYPKNFEHKIGFDEIRTLLKGRCVSSLGTEWVDKKIHFMTSYEEVTGSLEEAREFTRFEDECDTDLECDFYDVREALLHARPERTFLEETDLFNLKRSLQSVVIYYKEFAKSDEEKEESASAPCYFYPALQKMAGGVATFPQLVERIDATLNKYGKIKDTASPQLVTLRHQIEVGLRGISHSLRKIISEAQTAGYIDRDVAPTLRDGRLVVPVPPALKRKIKGIVHDESATGKTVFIEPAAIVEANNHVRELRAAERREVMRILQELAAEIRPHIPEIIDSLHFLGHIDYLRALNIFSNSCQSVVPQVAKCAQLGWVQARHPLLEQSLNRHGGKIVPLDISLKRDQRILLISGPNAGGKSVCLKTAGLLQYMLQCGMPVPADKSSTPGVFNDIFLDIGDEQSIEDELSTYSSHLLNLKEMMRRADAHSLLLIDEFGGGTEPQIGGALAEAVLTRFVKHSNWGIITTHYQNLKLFASHTPSVVNGAMLYDRAQMQPLFVLQTGNPGSSFAVEIARKIGIPEDVIKYAIELVGKDYVMSDKYLQDIVRDKMYWEKKRQNVHLREKQLEETVSRYEREMTEFQKERHVVLAQAKEEAKHLLDESNAKIENTIRSIREAQAEKEKTREARAGLAEFKEKLEQDKDAEDKIARKIAKIQRRQQRRQDGSLSKKQQNEKNQAIAAVQLRSSGKPAPANPGLNSDNGGFESGQFVRIAGQTAVGRVESVSGNSAKVLFGMMYTQVPFKRLEHCPPPKTNEGISKVSTFVGKETRDAMYEKKLHFTPDIDIRGMHVDEALTAVSYFIDDSIQLEQARVRILHGTGTGALRELVRKYLRTAPGVRSFRDEHVQFGGAGITVVEFD